MGAAYTLAVAAGLLQICREKGQRPEDGRPLEQTGIEAEGSAEGGEATAVHRRIQHAAVSVEGRPRQQHPQEGARRPAQQMGRTEPYGRMSRRLGQGAAQGDHQHRKGVRHQHGEAGDGQQIKKL